MLYRKNFPPDCIGGVVFLIICDTMELMLNSHKIAKLARGIIYFSLFTPLLIIPYTIWEYVFIRNIIFYFLAAVLLLLSLIFLKKNNNVDFIRSPLFWLILVFIGLRTVSGIWSIDPNNSFFGSETRMDGNLGYLMLFSWLFAVLVFLGNKEHWLKLFKISAIVAAAASVFGIIQAFFPEEWGAFAGKGKILFFNYRLIGPLGNSIFFAGYILPHIFLSPLIALKETKKNRKYLWIVLSVFFSLIVILTKTRGAIIAFFLIAAFLVLIGTAYFLKNNRKLLFRYFLFGLPILTIASVASRLLVWPRLESVFSISATSATRLILWKIGLIGFWDKWLLGWGPENFSYLFSKFYNPVLLKYSFHETWVDKPHNQFIELLSTTGILGLAFFSFIIIFVFFALLRLARKEKNNFLSCLLIFGVIGSYLVHIFFSFDTLESRIIFFIFLGFIIFLEIDYAKSMPKKSLVSAIKVIIWLIFLIGIGSLYIIGAKTVKAAYYASLANDSLINNRYGRSAEFFAKLKDIRGPYQNENWEILSDAVLKNDAAGKIPALIMKELLPSVISGLVEAAKGNPYNFSYHFRLGQMYSLAGAYINNKYLDDAIRELESAKEISPKRQVSDLMLAQVYYNKRDVDKGIKILEDLVAANGDISPEPYWYLGLFYDADGQFDKSYAYMLTAVSKGYGFKGFDEKILYVTVLGRQKDYAHMEPIYESITEEDPLNAKWWANLAAIYLELKKYDAARKTARQAIFLDPKFGDEGEKFIKQVDEAESGE